MGDVAMTVPVIKNALDQNPQLRITVVSNAFFAPVFSGMERCIFYPADLTTQHSGINGIYRLFKALKKHNRFDAVADFHGVLRSALLRTFFSFSGIPVAVIDKGRKEKKELTRKENKVVKQLHTSFERYAQVLSKLNIPVTLNDTLPVKEKQCLPGTVRHIFQQNKKVIGIAPFAQHAPKMYPSERLREIAKVLSQQYAIIFFGGGAAEKERLQQWEKDIPGAVNAAGKFSLQEELSIISNLHAMISMDSANMHLASLFQVPVISIWGATHPFAGFYGWGQSTNHIVSIDLFCRPCSVFGNKPCWRGDHACMQKIEDAMIIQKVQTAI